MTEFRVEVDGATLAATYSAAGSTALVALFAHPGKHRCLEATLGNEVEVVILAGTGHEPTVADASISLQYETKLIYWLRSIA